LPFGAGECIQDIMKVFGEYNSAFISCAINPCDGDTGKPTAECKKFYDDYAKVLSSNACKGFTGSDDYK
jgi:hypothetical protein